MYPCTHTPVKTRSDRCHERAGGVSTESYSVPQENCEEVVTRTQTEGDKPIFACAFRRAVRTWLFRALVPWCVARELLVPDVINFRDLSRFEGLPRGPFRV
jgi:hypothetical protein